MMGKRSVQRDLWEVPARIADRIDSDSIYRILHDLSPILLRDEDFEHLYASTGRPSHEPSLLMGALLLKEAADVSDREAQTVTCPAQETTSTYYTTTDKKGRKRHVFRFDGARCRDCDLREQCTTATNGRTISVHPHEEALRATRAFNATEAFDRIYRRRPVAERKNAQLFWQKGLRHSRYVGRRKTRLQALLTATVVNLKTIGEALQAAFSPENAPARTVAA